MKKLFKNKKVFICSFVLLFIISIGIGTFFYRNYNAYNNYINEFDKYGYSNNDFWEDNKFVRPETLSYMQYELDKTAVESNSIIKKFESEYGDADLTGTPKEKLDNINKYLDNKIDKTIEQIKLTKDFNDSEKEEYNLLNDKLTELQNDNSLNALSKMSLLTSLKSLNNDVDDFNDKVAKRIKKEEEEKKKQDELEKQQQQALISSNNWSSSATNNSSNNSSNSTSTFNNTTINTTNNNSNGNASSGCNGRYCNCPYPTQAAAINAGEKSGRSWMVEACDDGTFDIYLYDGDNGSDPNNNNGGFGTIGD